MASDGFEVKVKGLSELKDALKQLPENIAKNVLRGGVGAGAAVIRKEARAKAPVSTGPVSAGHPPPGTLKKSVYQKQIRELSNAVRQTFYVGVRKGLKGKAAGLGAYYARFVEFGTAKMPARPFLRPAWEAKKMEAIEAIRAYIAERIPREVDKLPKGPKS